MVKDIKNYVYIPIRVSIDWLITIRDYELYNYVQEYSEPYYLCEGDRAKRRDVIKEEYSIADIKLPKSIKKAQLHRGRNTRVVAVAVSRDNLPEFKQGAIEHNLSLGEYVRLRLLRNAYELLKSQTNLFYTIKWRFSEANPPV